MTRPFRSQIYNVWKYDVHSCCSSRYRIHVHARENFHWIKILPSPATFVLRKKFAEKIFANAVKVAYPHKTKNKIFANNSRWRNGENFYIYGTCLHVASTTHSNCSILSCSDHSFSSRTESTAQHTFTNLTFMAISWLWPDQSVHKAGCPNTISQPVLNTVYELPRPLKHQQGSYQMILYNIIIVIIIVIIHLMWDTCILLVHMYSCIVFTEYIAWKWMDLPLRGKKRWRFIAPLSRSEGWWHHSTTPVVQNSTRPWLPYLICTCTCICSIPHWQNTKMELTSTVELISADNTIFSSWEKAQHWTPYLCPLKSHIFCLVLMSHT